MEFIKTTRGASKLLYGGHAYTKKRASKTTATWECSQRRAYECKGTVITDLAATEVKSTRAHCHENDPFYIQALKVKEQIKASVEANQGLPHQMVDLLVAMQPLGVRVAMGTTETLKRYNRRLRVGKVPEKPRSQSETPINRSEQYASQLIHDNESTDLLLVNHSTE